ncbi:MAG: NUDIX hydrolase [Saprospiraceae bacterium]|nr:NUDIX hydrolase [Saprospiraceae bacterium]
MVDKSLKDWDLIKEELGPDLPLFTARFQHMQNPRNGKSLKAIVLEVPDTINVICVTKESEIILVEQYRFGIGKLLKELPAGLLEDGEMPLEAAKRELREETGYISDDWTFLGKSFINPAYVTNACYHFLAIESSYEGGILPDETEDLKVHRVKIKAVSDLSNMQILEDAIGKAAFCALDQYLRS